MQLQQHSCTTRRANWCTSVPTATALVAESRADSLSVYWTAYCLGTHRTRHRSMGAVASAARREKPRRLLMVPSKAYITQIRLHGDRLLFCVVAALLLVSLAL